MTVVVYFPPSDDRVYVSRPSQGVCSFVCKTSRGLGECELFLYLSEVRYAQDGHIFTRGRHFVLLPFSLPSSHHPQLYTLVQHVEVADIKGLQTENYDQA